MNSHLQGMQELHDRLLKLERQNLRLKRIGAAALVVAFSLLVMGQAPQKRTVEADEFILKDGDGNVRARLSMNAALDAPKMVFFDAKGRPSVEVNGGFVPTAGNVSVQGGGMLLFDSKGEERASFLVDDNGAYFRLSDVQGSAKTLLREGAVLVQDGALIANSKETKAAAVVLSDSIQVSDGQGFVARLGTGELVTPKTGETHKTSAASLVLLDKDKNVIWHAP